MHTNHAWLGLARTIYIYGVYTVILAGKSPNIRCIYTYIYTVLVNPTHGSAACTQITHAHKSHMARVGQNHICIRCIYGNFGREITKSTVYIYVYIYGSGQPYTWQCLHTNYTCTQITHGMHGAAALPAHKLHMHTNYTWQCCLHTNYTCTQITHAR